MTYVDENGVVVVATAGSSVNIYVGNHEQVIYPYTEEVPTILKGLLIHLQHQIEQLPHDTDETHDAYDAASTLLRYLEQSR